MDGSGEWYSARGDWGLTGFGEGGEGPSKVVVDDEIFVYLWRVFALADKGALL